MCDTFSGRPAAVRSPELSVYYCSRMSFINLIFCPINLCYHKTRLVIINVIFQLRRGYTWRLFWRRLTRPFWPISRSRFKQRWISLLIPIPTVWRFCVNFWVIFGHYGKGIFFLKESVKLRKIWNIKDLMDLENWNLKWRISRRIPNSPLPTWGSHLGWSTIW